MITFTLFVSHNIVCVCVCVCCVPAGAVSATRESMDYLLGREGTGRALCLVVGGAKESLDCHPGEVSLHLSKRKGFCKMALRHG